MLTIRRILHPTDFSPSSDAALRLAAVLAKDHDAQVVLLHVIEPPPVGSSGAVPAPPPGLPPSRAEVEQRLSALAATLPGLRTECRVAEGPAADAILEAAQETGCDVIVMGTHGRTGLARLLVGSVAEKVVRRAPCPVLTVKSPQATPQ
jgi:nucleotide-binding universal stress UspA family protein